MTVSIKKTFHIPIALKDVTDLMRLFVKSHIPLLCILPLIPLFNKVIRPWYQRRAIKYENVEEVEFSTPPRTQKSSRQRQKDKERFGDSGISCEIKETCDDGGKGIVLQVARNSAKSRSVHHQMSTASEHGTIPLMNPILAQQTEDHLYHFGILRSAFDLPGTYGDVKYVCCGGSPTRLALYAELFAKDMGFELSRNLSNSDRYVMYKTGPVLWVNHGMGAPSLSIMLTEMIKLLHYARATNVTFFRLGTSGGLGVPPGTVLISSGAVNGEMEEFHIQYIMGRKTLRPAILDQGLKDELYGIAKGMKLPVDTGKTLCADDFYEGQARLDGAFCDYTVKDKFAFLEKLYKRGVRNIEMESTCFAALTHRAGIKAAIVCVTLLNRMKGDQVQVEKAEYVEFETRPFRVVTTYIKKKIAASRQ